MSDKGGAAFPALNFIIPNDLEERHVRRLGETQGMTLRDYAAIKFAAALIVANPHEIAPTDGMGIIEAALAYADEFIEQRKEREGVSDEG